MSFPFFALSEADAAALIVGLIVALLAIGLTAAVLGFFGGESKED